MPANRNLCYSISPEVHGGVAMFLCGACDLSKQCRADTTFFSDGGNDLNPELGIDKQMKTASIVQGLRNNCKVLRSDNMSLGDYAKPFNYLLCLKVVHERRRPPYNQPSP
jgi:hypothetical protein